MLTTHIGIVSSMGNNKQPSANSFKSEDFDALQLLSSIKEPTPIDNIAVDYFIGTWQFYDQFNRPIRLFTLNNDHMANKQPNNVKGRWAFTDKEVVIEWLDGWKDVLTPSHEGAVKKAYRPVGNMSVKPYFNTEIGVRKT